MASFRVIFYDYSLGVVIYFYRSVCNIQNVGIEQNLVRCIKNERKVQKLPLIFGLSTKNY